MAWTSIGPTPQWRTARFLGENPVAQVLGPVAGRVEALAFSADTFFPPLLRVTRPALFAGSCGGGVWRLTNVDLGPPNWELVTPNPDGVVDSDMNHVSVSFQAGINRIGALAVDREHPSVVLVGSGDPEWRGGAGLLRSQRGGGRGSWVLIAQAPRWSSVAKLLLDPTDATRRSVLVALVPQNIFRSAPASTGGLYRVTPSAFPLTQEWEWRTLNPGFTDPRRPTAVIPYDLGYVIRNNRIRLIAALVPRTLWPLTEYNPEDSGIWVSDDGGNQWRQAPFFPPNVDAPFEPSQIARIALATSEDRSPSVIYAAIGGYRNLLAVLRSRNGGDTWQTLNIGAISLRVVHGSGIGSLALGQANYNLAIGMQPDRPSRVYLGLVRTIATEEGLIPGTLGPWSWLDAGQVRGQDRLMVHPDHHAWLVAPNHGPAYDASDGGIWVQLVILQAFPLGFSAEWPRFSRIFR